MRRATFLLVIVLSIGVGSFATIPSPVQGGPQPQSRLEFNKEIGAYRFSATEAPWWIEFAAPDFRCERAPSTSKATKRAAYWFLEDKTNISVFFFISPASACNTSPECRDLLWDKEKANVNNPQRVSKYDIHEFSILQYSLPYEKTGVMTMCVSGYLVRDGYLLEVKMSKPNAKDGDNLILENLLKLMTIKNK
jgi:hypothetical protein